MKSTWKFKTKKEKAEYEIFYNFKKFKIIFEKAPMKEIEIEVTIKE